MIYRVLHPAYTKTGETFYTSEGKKLHWERVEWKDLGIASNIEDAKAKFGGRPVT